MSDDHTRPDPSSSGHDYEQATEADAALAKQLQAFGATLASVSDTRISPEPARPPAKVASIDVDAHVDDQVEADPSHQGRDRRSLYLLAVAALVAVVGIAAASIWSGEDDTIGPADTVSGEDDRSDGDDDVPTTIGDSGDPETGRSRSGEQPTEAAPADAPSVIVDSGGSPLANVDDPAPLLSDSVAGSGGPTGLRNEGDVIARAVVAELVERQILGAGLDRAEVVEALATGGFQVTTTIDSAAMAAAAQAVGELYPDGDRRDQLGLVTIDNSSGAIVAVHSTAPAVPVMTEQRHPAASAFKPLVLATLVEQGSQLEDLVSGDGPCIFTTVDGDQQEIGGTDRGDISLLSATISSNNCAYARLGLLAGPAQVVDQARAMGLPLADAAESSPRLALGVDEVRPLDLAAAYTVFANRGEFRAPWLVAEVTDRHGRSIYRSQAFNSVEAVLSPDAAALVTSALEANVERGTGTRARLEGHAVAGKTGTMDGFTDAWFVGYSRYFTTAVWWGDDWRLRAPGWNSFGGGLPAAVWGAYNTALHQDLEPLPLADPPAPDRDPVVLGRPFSEIVDPTDNP